MFENFCVTSDYDNIGRAIYTIDNGSASVSISPDDPGYDGMEDALDHGDEDYIRSCLKEKHHD